MKCDRCHKETPSDKYNCVHCGFRNPNMSEAHNRWNDWKCSSCGADNGGAWKRCGKCDAKKP
ncbi:hypothetical protein Lesp01_17060 [Lentzea sp. NBRC 102530]|nr:hypothetical protein Lesp01_17060 [Lentzea sp. NBRC 102530]